MTGLGLEAHKWYAGHNIWNTFLNLFFTHNIDAPGVVECFGRADKTVNIGANYGQDWFWEQKDMLYRWLGSVGPPTKRHAGHAISLVRRAVMQMPKLTIQIWNIFLQYTWGGSLVGMFWSS